jgi:hypothetical protein
MKQEYFYHNGQKYGVGTEFWFTGICRLNGENVFLKDERCVFKYICMITGYVVFDVKGEETWCGSRTFEKSICLAHERTVTELQEELYLSKESFSKLLWYIIIMVVGVIFYDRWLIWIGATIVFVATTPEVKQFIKNLKGGK